MKYGKGILIVFSIIIVGLISFAIFFSQTGGNGLYRIVINYLIPNLPENKYSWGDFMDRGVDQEISGFYSSGDVNSFKIWTLSGLKTFHHLPGTSVYIFRDTCKVYKQIATNNVTEGVGATNNEEVTPGLFKWILKMQKEYFVTVKRLPNQYGHDMVDKAWSSSGKYKILGQIEEGVCD